MTSRLLLRPFSLEDAPRVKTLAGDWEIARVTANIPHPYEDGMAETWISGHSEAFEAGNSASFAVTLKKDGLLIGAIGLHFSVRNHSAEIGYWIGVPYWGQGYCTEAARAILEYGFEERDLNRIQARHITENPASGRVMQKLGMTPEGTMRQAIFSWGTYRDSAMYAILRDEYKAD
jgi:RimJ/RimL family protein N-acetyltransferase